MDINELHEKLKEFILTNREYIQWDKIQKFAPNLHNDNPDSWLGEFVSTCHP